MVKLFKNMTDQEKAKSTNMPWLFDDNDLFVDYEGNGNYQYQAPKGVFKKGVFKSESQAVTNRNSSKCKVFSRLDS